MLHRDRRQLILRSRTWTVELVVPSVTSTNENEPWVRTVLTQPRTTTSAPSCRGCNEDKKEKNVRWRLQEMTLL